MVQNVRSGDATTSSITVRWNELSCVDRNGGLTDYRIEYGTSTTFDNIGTVTGTQTSFTANGLIPFTSYVFRVATLSGSSTGPFSNVVSMRTLLPSGNTVNASYN